MKLQERVEDILKRITYREGYRFIFERDKKDAGGRFYLQIEADRIDVVTGKMGVGRGGKAYLSEYATGSELVRTMLGLALAYEEHEVREFFKVDGVAVFGPHIALDALLEAGKHLDYRTEEKPVEAESEPKGANTYMHDYHRWIGLLQ